MDTPLRALVTGGTSGLGLAMVRALVEDGAHVVLTGRDGDRAVALLGGLDVVVLNAGLGMRTVNPRFLTEPQPFWEVDPDAFRAVVDTNLTGYFLTARAAVPALLDGGGRLVVVSMNHTTMVRRGFVPYGPSRAGAESLARIMAADLAGSGVTVNILLPGGATRTGMLPEGVEAEGLLDPEIMVPPLRWLCSDAAAGVHDQRLVATEFETWLAARQTPNV